MVDVFGLDVGMVVSVVAVDGEGVGVLVVDGVMDDYWSMLVLELVE